MARQLIGPRIELFVGQRAAVEAERGSFRRALGLRLEQLMDLRKPAHYHASTKEKSRSSPRRAKAAIHAHPAATPGTGQGEVKAGSTGSGTARFSKVRE